MATNRSVKRLELRAVRGDVKAQKQLADLNDKTAKEVNRRLRELERRGYDYYAYNTPTHFTETVYETDRFKLSKNMDEDYQLMSTQTQIGLKFLGMESSTVKGQQDIEERRFESFVDLGIVEEDYSKRKFRNFLKFLSNEESEMIIESWSTSDTMVEALFDAYNRKANTKNKMLGLFREYGEGKRDIFATFDKLGVNLHAYRKFNREW